MAFGWMHGWTDGRTCRSECQSLSHELCFWQDRLLSSRWVCTMERHSHLPPALHCGSRHPLCLRPWWLQACRGLGLPEAHGEALLGPNSGTPLGLSFLLEIMSRLVGMHIHCPHRAQRTGEGGGGVSFFQSVFSVCPIRASMLPHSLTTGKELEKRGQWKRGREKASREVHLWPETAAGASWPLRGWESQTFLGGLALASGGDFFPATGNLKHSCFLDP